MPQGARVAVYVPRFLVSCCLFLVTAMIHVSTADLGNNFVVKRPSDCLVFILAKAFSSLLLSNVHSFYCILVETPCSSNLKHDNMYIFIAGV